MAAKGNFFELGDHAGLKHMNEALETNKCIRKKMNGQPKVKRRVNSALIKILLALACLNCLGSIGMGQLQPAMREIDRTRIAEAFRVGEKLKNDLWRGWDKGPFGLLFVDDDHEFLMRHPKPSDEFQSIGYDKLLKSEVFVRPRKFSKNFLATFPAFDRTPIIVVGRAENTSAKTSTPWVFVVLHEHFHQLQMTLPKYFADVETLNLSRGDTTGMWQLNFPFPYRQKEVADKFKSLSDLLLHAYLAKRGGELETKLAKYLKARREFEEMLGSDDYKYISFQLWQEGIARYTQYRMAELAGRKLRPSRAFRSLNDFKSFNSESERLRKATLDEVRRIDLTDQQRVAFYPFGGVEGLLLDRVNPKWRGRYLKEKFQVEDFYFRK